MEGGWGGEMVLLLPQLRLCTPMNRRKKAFSAKKREIRRILRKAKMYRMNANPKQRVRYGRFEWRLVKGSEHGTQTHAPLHLLY